MPSHSIIFMGIRMGGKSLQWLQINILFQTMILYIICYIYFRVYMISIIPNYGERVAIISNLKQLKNETKFSLTLSWCGRIAFSEGKTALTFLLFTLLWNPILFQRYGVRNLTSHRQTGEFKMYFSLTGYSLKIRWREHKHRVLPLNSHMYLSWMWWAQPVMYSRKSKCNAESQE